MNKNLRILKWIYTEGLKENPMPYKELAEHCGVCSATIASVVRKLEAFGILPILKILGLFRNWRVVGM